MRKLGLIAGGGALPAMLADHCAAAGRPYFVLRLKGFADAELAGHPGAEVGIAEVGRILNLAAGAGCSSLCLVGAVQRPNFASLKPDAKGLTVLPSALAAARAGDDALLRFLMGVFEKEGFAIEGAHEVMAGLTLPAGPLGARVPAAAHQPDIALALRIARAIGALDIGQGAVVCDELVLAVEAQEGTDALLARVATLPEAVRGTPRARRGVLAKAPKPIQEERVDLPTIGPATIEGAARAGLAGIVGVAGKLIVVEREALIAAADAAGLFVVGVADA
jgi:UDP-2,3-diacylglucosamine hydrolase